MSAVEIHLYLPIFSSVLICVLFVRALCMCSVDHVRPLSLLSINKIIYQIVIFYVLMFPS